MPRSRCSALFTSVSALGFALALLIPQSVPANAAPAPARPQLRYDAASGVGKVTVLHKPSQTVRVHWGDGSTSRISGCAVRLSPDRCKAVVTHVFTHQGDAAVRVVVGRHAHQVGIVTRTPGHSADVSSETQTPPASPRDSHELPATWRTDMLASVNDQRAATGAPKLRSCSRLDEVAQAYAATMASRNHYGHTGPDGESPWDRMAAKGYVYRQAAENIAAGYGTVAEVQKGWIESPGHYSNMVNPGLEDVGFGYAYSPDSTYGTYWVQVFGTGGSC